MKKAITVKYFIDFLIVVYILQFFLEYFFNMNFNLIVYNKNFLYRYISFFLHKNCIHFLNNIIPLLFFFREERENEDIGTVYLFFLLYMINFNFYMVKGSLYGLGSSGIVFYLVTYACLKYFRDNLTYIYNIIFFKNGLTIGGFIDALIKEIDIIFIFYLILYLIFNIENNPMVDVASHRIGIVFGFMRYLTENLNVKENYNDQSIR